jgi:hypothetical protein
VITRREDPHFDTETNRPVASDSSEARARWSPLRWYADSFRPEPQPAVTSSASHIDFFGIFLHRALAGRGDLETRA